MCEQAAAEDKIPNLSHLPIENSGVKPCTGLLGVEQLLAG